MIGTDSPQYERRVLLLMALVQFINIWDFMIVMPLGPDFAQALGIDAGHIGWIAGSYSISAAIIGILSARFLDRFDRRDMLVFALGGLALTTFLTILATSLTELIAVRILTGICGGPVMAASLAVIADVFPEHRRGEAMGKVFGSFSIAAVLGVPVGLEIARWFGWWAPFIAISLVALGTLVTIRLYLPPMRVHLAAQRGGAPFSLSSSLRHNPSFLIACALIGFSTFSGFLIIPNISAHVQQNMHYPREWLGLLYFCGGGAAFFSMRFAGRQSDRIGYAKTSLHATVILCLTLFSWFYAQFIWMPVLVWFVLYMIAMSTRNVTSNALISKIPHASERAGFMSAISAIQHLMSGVGAMCATFLLVETPGGQLAGIEHVALLAMLTAVVMPWMMYKIEKAVARRKEDALVKAEISQL